MDDMPMGFKEVIPDQTYPSKWKEFIINAGGTQSTLQDIKVPERAGGFSYKDSSKHYTRNRFIYWRITGDVLELVEQSLEINLTGNHVRYKFQDTAVLEGLGIHEAGGGTSVVLLVATVSSVHRLTFPHPDLIHKKDHLSSHHPEMSVPSIFAEASQSAARDPATFHVINNASTNSMLPHTSASWLSANDDALFALAYASGSVLLLSMGSSHIGLVTSAELKQTSVINRLWSGFMPEALRSRAGASGNFGVNFGSGGEVAMGMVMHPIANETFLFCLCRDGRLRMWSTAHKECKLATYVLEGTAESGRRLLQGTQNHMLRKAVSSDGNTVFLGAYMCFSNECAFCVLKPVLESGIYQLIRLATIYAPEHDLVDFQFSQFRLWAVWTVSDGSMLVSSILMELGEGRASAQRSQDDWEPAILETPPQGLLFPWSPANEEGVDPTTDPRHAYLAHIFHPGRFPLAVIAKALAVYRRVPGGGLVGQPQESIPPAAVLRDRVSMAVDSDIRMELSGECGEYVAGDEEYREVSMRCWARLLLCCEQYQEAGARPMGLVPGDGGLRSPLALIRRSQLSLFRPADALEYLASLDEPASVPPAYFASTPILGKDPQVCSDMCRVVGALAVLEKRLPNGLKAAFECDLHRLRSPDSAMAHIAHALLCDSSGENVLDPCAPDSFWKCLEDVKNMYAAMLMLLKALTLDHDQPNDLILEDPDPSSSRVMMSVNYLFSSQLGISMIAESLHQIAVVRFSMCRNLLLLQHLILECSGDGVGFGGSSGAGSLGPLIDEEHVNGVRSDLIPRTTLLTQAYLLLKWVTETPCAPNPPPSNSLENSLEQMTLLRESRPSGSRVPMVHAAQGRGGAWTLAELFLACEGGQHAHALSLRLLDRGQPSTSLFSCQWHTAMLPYITLVGQLIWPISRNFIFPEFLLSSRQYVLIQEYVRLLQSWCEWNSCSRKFMLGVALLIGGGECDKAYDLVVQAAEGVGTDHFMASALLQHSSKPQKGLYPNLRTEVECGGLSAEEEDPPPSARLLVLYYLQVIKLFDQLGYHDRVIALAKTAITVADPHDPDLPTLHSIMFREHLRLGHWSEAQEALVSNPEGDRRRDCLRQLVTALWERGELRTLVNLPSGVSAAKGRLGGGWRRGGTIRGEEEEVETVLEARARAIDLSGSRTSAGHSYYDFLYAFHITKGNMRKAACVMYEQAMRLEQEVMGCRDGGRSWSWALDKRARCLLACLNALCLVQKRYAWIVKPLPRGEASPFQDGSSFEGRTPKRHRDGEEVLQSRMKRQVEVLEYKDIKKEYEVVIARLKLIKYNPDHATVTGLARSEEELLGELAKAGMYDNALRLGALLFEGRTDCEWAVGILETAASACVRLLPNGPSSGFACAGTEIGGSRDSMSAWDMLADNDLSMLGVGDAPAVSLSWKLLEHFVNKYETPGQTILHKAVATKILSMGAFLPHWLLASYKRRDPSELLRIFLEAGRLSEGGSLAIECVWAALGKGTECWGLESAIHANKPQLCLPHGTFHLYLLELGDATPTDPEYEQLHKDLKDVLTLYLRTVTQVSVEMANQKAKLASG
ncbi:nuclear pore complex protein Nup160 homolog isoform X2 [Ischnura elegans]|uniref:nuclear pore complex protein Nup160 homolog isoform X2 n=1 Tax=Ischnura elegans TaxID=197161 RepID=UPI001ED8ABB6|nr:nuclear pore complex protein Nup160 homolog isoform X2 [Ischnura elegans]